MFAGRCSLPPWGPPVAVDGGAGRGSSQRWWVDDTNGVPLCARQGRLVWVEPVKWWGVSGCLSNGGSLPPTRPPARRCPHSAFHQNAALGPPGDVRGMPAALAVGCRGMCGARGTTFGYVWGFPRAVFLKTLARRASVSLTVKAIRSYHPVMPMTGAWHIVPSEEISALRAQCPHQGSLHFSTLSFLRSPALVI